jgi:hypothetical protein
MNRASGSSLLAVIGILVAIVALWRPEVSVSSGAGYRLALSLPDWLMVLLAIAALAMCLAVIATRRKGPGDFGTPETLRLSPAAILLLFLILPGAIAGVRSALHLINPDVLGAFQYGSLSRVTSNPANEPDTINVPLLDTALTILLAVLAAGITGFALLVIRARQPWAFAAEWLRVRRHKPPRPAPELVSAISAGIRALELGDDPRGAVIACYRRCEAALAAQRRRRYLSETPREFVHGALAAFALPANAVRSLLLVFERARFSDLPVTETDRSVAFDALAEIRAALEGRSEDAPQS